jgi:hypothetical protein
MTMSTRGFGLVFDTMLHDLSEQSVREMAVLTTCRDTSSDPQCSCGNRPKPKPKPKPKVASGISTHAALRRELLQKLSSGAHLRA